MAEKKIDPREELSQKVEQCLTVQDIHKKVTLANDYRKRFQNGFTVIKPYLIKVEENTPIWHALIVIGTHCCVNQTIGRET